MKRASSNFANDFEGIKGIVELVEELSFFYQVELVKNFLLCRDRLMPVMEAKQ